jgi:hypothetical protein
LHQTTGKLPSASKLSKHLLCGSQPGSALDKGNEYDHRQMVRHVVVGALASEAPG